MVKKLICLFVPAVICENLFNPLNLWQKKVSGFFNSLFPTTYNLQPFYVFCGSKKNPQPTKKFFTKTFARDKKVVIFADPKGIKFTIN
jgi:hypothetical protein